MQRWHFFPDLQDVFLTFFDCRGLVVYGVTDARIVIYHGGVANITNGEADGFAPKVLTLQHD